LAHSKQLIEGFSFLAGGRVAFILFRTHAETKYGLVVKKKSGREDPPKLKACLIK
jgi:hypothetical protein